MDNIAAFMPIKMNSRRVPRKNIRMVAGRPLFCWLAQAADTIGIPFYIFTNSEWELREHMDFVPMHMEFITRSLALDTDEAAGIDIYREFRKKVPASAYLLLHCTSPFLSIKTIERVVDAVLKDGYNSSLTVQKKQAHIWYGGYPLNFKAPRPQTNNIKPIYIETIGAFCYKSGVLNGGDRVDDKNVKFIEVDHIEAIDIDIEEDLRFADIIGRGLMQK